jgi:3-hydroxybutyryl-CoA dehydratase
MPSILIGSYVAIGETASFAKTITDADVALFSAISGDFDPIHVDDAYAAATSFGRRIAHGLGVLALLSGVESEISRRVVGRGSPLKPISLGYDRVRFLLPVFIGESVTAHYRIASLDEDRRRSVGDCRIDKTNGELCVVAEHIMKWVG